MRNPEVPLKSIVIAAAIGAAALGMSTSGANAAGCLKGAILGGVAGHYAGHHGWLGAGAGCLLGRQLANRPVRPQTTRQHQYGNRVITDRYGGIVARDQSAIPARDAYGNTVTRYRSDNIGYGSSMPDRIR
jgi:hypothetical protein